MTYGAKIGCSYITYGKVSIYQVLLKSEGCSFLCVELTWVCTIIIITVLLV